MIASLFLSSLPGFQLLLLLLYFLIFEFCSCFMLSNAHVFRKLCLLPGWNAHLFAPYPLAFIVWNDGEELPWGVG